MPNISQADKNTLLAEIENCQNLLNSIVLSGNNEFNFPCPICWFGNIETEKPIIFTMGINPSCDEFIPPIPASTPCRFRGMGLGNITDSSLYDAYNGYFSGASANPYGKWFSMLQRRVTDAGIDGCFHSKEDKQYKYQLVHVDLFPFATDPKWSELVKKYGANNPIIKQCINAGNTLLHKLIQICQPKAIISFGAYRDKVKYLNISSISAGSCPAASHPANSSSGIKYPHANSDGYTIRIGKYCNIPIILTSGCVEFFETKADYKAVLAEIGRIFHQL